jgi:nucleoside-diphosphate-sugar epimerase
MDDILSGKTILITGGTGLLGSAVGKALLQEGHRVRLMVRNPQRAQALVHLGGEVIQADLTNPPSLERAVTGSQIVLHFAGALTGDTSDKAYFQKVNVEGSLLLAQAALSGGVERFLHASTAWVYGFAANPGTTERSPYLVSKGLYIDTKIEAEQQLQQLRLEKGLPLVVVQPSQVFGPEDKHWTLTSLRYIQNGQMILVNKGSGSIQPIYIDDVVVGVLAAVRQGRIGEAYLLCGSEAITLKRFYGELAGLLGRKKIPTVPGWLGMMLASLFEGLSTLTHRPPLFTRAILRANTMHASYDGTKARTELGFVPQISLEEGMSRVAAWLTVADPLGQKSKGS